MPSRHRLEREPIELPDLSGPLGDIWDALAMIAAAANDLPWTVVGGQMVLLHGLEHGTAPDRVSTDIDAAVDVRADHQAVAKLVGILTELEYRSAGTSLEGRAYRFEKSVGVGTAVVDVTVDEEQDDGHDGVGPEGGTIVVDVLVPEGLGSRAPTRTVGNATAFPAPGISQALGRTELVPLVIQESVAWIPRPNLLGAIVAKATAADVDSQDPERHHRDVVFLCGLVDDPLVLAEDVGKKDKRRLRRLAEILPPEDAIWDRHPDARAALELLIGD